MSGALPLLPRPMSPWSQGQNCPCCRKPAESPRLLGCLHSVCSPCLNKVENILRILEKKKGIKTLQGTGSPFLPPRALLPLGKFLCPVCNTSHLISRLGVSVIPLSMSLHNNTYCEDKQRCSLHAGTIESYCYSCNKQLCKECLEDAHGQHHTEDMDRVKNSLDRTLRDAVKEIAERMQTIETDIGRIRVARESEVHERRKLRREVVTYYEGYVKDVNRHKSNMERKISLHHENSANILIKEEVQLEQYRMDLKMLCAQIQKLLTIGNCMEVVNLMVPLAKKLEKISEEILATGEAIINKLQFVPKSLSHGDIPGFVSTFAVCQAKSHAIIDRPIYEKVLCSIRLYLADDNGLKLDVYRDLKIQAVMTLYDQLAKNCQMVEVSIKNTDSGGWSLNFNPPFSGIAHLSVTVDGTHIKNSPYVIHVRKLALDDSYVNEISSHKKSVKFSEIVL
eukprot:GFUD01009156.1.p1 GENE.GFUD01009156.1~~GFUD01009156.1.p1  ORF type:complete len:451 (+),score=101.13 GFUD01009156.1:407-1759(+)